MRPIDYQDREPTTPVNCAMADALMAIFGLVPVPICPRCHGPEGYNVEGCEKCGGEHEAD